MVLQLLISGDSLSDEKRKSERCYEVAEIMIDPGKLAHEAMG